MAHNIGTGIQKKQRELTKIYDDFKLKKTLWFIGIYKQISAL